MLTKGVGTEKNYNDSNKNPNTPQVLRIVRSKKKKPYF